MIVALQWSPHAGLRAIAIWTMAVRLGRSIIALSANAVARIRNISQRHLEFHNPFPLAKANGNAMQCNATDNLHIKSVATTRRVALELW